jgi:TATA-box binding protein (TBP) (component of TFIID and TFIIIB)
MTSHLELSDFVGKPCASRTAYEFVPKRKQDYDLEKLSQKLRKEGVYIEVDTPILMMLKAGERNLTLFRSGKIVVKETKDEKTARAAAQELVRKINA